LSSKLARPLAALTFALAALIVVAGAGVAMPIFAQRYLLPCETCHTVLPELNSFGEEFRRRGYRLPTPAHGTTLVAIRYQLEYEKDPAPGSRRYTPGGVLLSDVEVGQINAYLHYNFGAQGGPAGAYLAFLTTASDHTRSTYRAGLWELPLIHSPGQRLDDLTTYGYEGTHVGLNDLTLAQPRWGVQGERQIGVATVAATIALGEFKGAAYGGKPIDTGVSTGPAAPEVGLFLRMPVTGWFGVSVDALTGNRAISAVGKPLFTDPYRRTALGVRADAGRIGLLAQQWWGSDANADGFGTRVDSSGGFVRLRYSLDPGDHAYIGVRYDAAAAPTATRDTVLYGAVLIFGRARLLFQNVFTPGGGSSFGGALTVAFPSPLKYPSH
jgi:hypothetical protein